MHSLGKNIRSLNFLTEGGGDSQREGGGTAEAREGRSRSGEKEAAGRTEQEKENGGREEEGAAAERGGRKEAGGREKTKTTGRGGTEKTRRVKVLRVGANTAVLIFCLSSSQCSSCQKCVCVIVFTPVCLHAHNLGCMC